jgi:hypothetical protein
MCGAPLPGDVRWCTTCYEPVRELTPRAPLHHGDYVGALTPAGPDTPHWSRWEASATTFGPVGRIVMTVVLGLTLVGALQVGAVVYVIVFPVAATVILPAIWAKGWVVPGVPEQPPLPVTDRDAPATTPAGRLARLAIWGAATLACMAIVYGSSPVRIVAILLVTLVGLVTFWRRYLSA